ncbi:MAG: hypothetical protein LBH03_06625, partial [Holophagales bacterium]|nr:hypothetical protein [Holophagales bacterium]
MFVTKFNDPSTNTNILGIASDPNIAEKLALMNLALIYGNGKNTSNIIGNGIGDSNSSGAKIVDKYSTMSNKEIRSQLQKIKIEKKVNPAIVVAQFSQISNSNILRTFDAMKALTNDRLELVYYKSIYYEIGRA